METLAKAAPTINNIATKYFGAFLAFISLPFVSLTDPTDKELILSVLISEKFPRMNFRQHTDLPFSEHRE